jgi:hypothetical protein
MPANMSLPTTTATAIAESMTASGARGELRCIGRVTPSRGWRIGPLKRDADTLPRADVAGSAFREHFAQIVAKAV